MRTIQRAIQVVVCGLCVATTLPAQSAERQSGFYVGLGAGQSSFDVDKSELDAAVLDAFFSQGIVTSASSKLEDSDTAWSLVAGYHFNPYIAIEAGYVDLGTAEYRSTVTVNPFGSFVSEPASLDLDVGSKGITVAALGSLPLSDIVDLHGHLGFLFAKTDVTATARIGSGVGVDSDSFDSTSGFFGVGAGFHLGEHWSLSLDWTRYDNVGDEDEDDDARTEAGFNIDALSVSAMFRF